MSNFQGRLTDVSGVPQSGPFDFQFLYYDAPAAGTLLLTEQQLGVTVTSGIYNVTLGSGGLTTAAESTFAGVFANHGTVYLEVQVKAGGGPTYDVLSPRTQLTAAPFAVNADKLDGLDASAFAPASGSANYAPATGSANYVAKAGDTMAGALNLPANGLAVGGSQLAVAGGFVGIGAPAPIRRLQVLGSQGSLSVDPDTVAGSVVLRGGLSTESVSLFDINNESAGGSLRVYATSDIVFRTSSLPGGAAVIQQAGNVGIGSTAPTTKLDVAGTIRSSSGGFMFPDGSTQATAAASGANTALSNLTATAVNLDLLPNVDNALDLGSPANSWRTVNADTSVETPILRSGAVLSLVATGANSITATTNGLERLRVDGAGKVGINQTAPGAMLDITAATGGGTRGLVIKEDASQSVNLLEVQDSSAASMVRITSTGDLEIYNPGATLLKHKLSMFLGVASYLAADAGSNVGIGTTAPATKLDVAGTVTATAFSGSGAGLTGIAAAGGWTDGGANVALTTISDSVGIGIATPSAKLHVMDGDILVDRSAGAATLTLGSTSGATPQVVFGGTSGGILSTSSNTLALRFASGASASSVDFEPAKVTFRTGGFAGFERLTITSTGNVGIGTTAPAKPLDVAGNIGSSGTVSAVAFVGDGSGLTGLNAANVASGTLSVSRGGTGLASYTVGDIPYASGATTLANLADVATGNALISGGIGVAPSWGKIGLTTHVSGTLPVGSGGTGATSLTAGSVLFAGAGGTSIAQNNTNLYWDSGTLRLGIGTNAPITQLANTNASFIDQGAATVAGGGLSWATSGAGYVAGFNQTLGGGTGNGLLVKIANTTGAGILTLNSGSAQGTDRFVVLGSGNVGIGTNAPADLLHLNAGAPSLALQGTTAARTYKFLVSGAGQFQINDATAAANRLTIEAAGNVGIGSSTPGQKLTVAGTVESTSGGFKFPDGTTQATAATGGTGGAGQVTFWTGASAQSGDANLFWDNTNKRLGIGTGTTGTNKLRIVGSAANEKVIFESSVGSGNPGIIVKANTPAGQAHFSADRADTGADASLFLLTGGALDWMVRTNPGSSNLSIMNNTATEVMTVLQTGNVGIGTTAPGVLLDVNGIAQAVTVKVGSGGLTQLGAGVLQNTSGGLSLSGSTGVFLQASGGSVGIGTTSPASILDLAFAGSNGIRVNSTNGSAPSVKLYQAGVEKATFHANSGDSYVGTSDASNFHLISNNASRVMIDTAGNVGIGTTAPAEKVDVSGNVRLTGKVTIPDANGTTDGNASNDVGGDVICNGAVGRITIAGGDASQTVFTVASTSVTANSHVFVTNTGTGPASIQRVTISAGTFTVTFTGGAPGSGQTFDFLVIN